MEQIAPGDHVIVSGRFGPDRELRAVSGVVMQTGFHVVWACDPHEWEEARLQRRDVRALPFPIEHVRLARHAARH